MRSKFEIRFYLVAILFIIFDLEISYLFPWFLVSKYLNFFGFFSMLFFILFSAFGYIYEWLIGVLDW